MLKNMWDRFWKFAHTGLGTALIVLALSSGGLKIIFDKAQVLGISMLDYVLDNIIFVDVTLHGWNLIVFIFGPVILLWLYGKLEWGDSVTKELETIENNSIEEVEEAVEDEEVSTELVLEEGENTILEIYKNNDGGSFTLFELDRDRTMHAFNKLKIEQLLDFLVEKNLLEPYYNVYEATRYGLTTEGRDYILEHLN